MEASLHIETMEKGAQLTTAKNYTQRALVNFSKEVESKAIQLMHRSEP